MRYTVDAETGCWLWTGALTDVGYPTFTVKGVTLYAHRVMYTLHVADLRRGWDLDHLCRTPRCVNPQHLEAVTHAENMRRGKNVRLTKQQVDEMRRRRATGETVADLAREFEISGSHASRLLRGLKWAEPQDPEENRAHMRKAA